MTKHAIDIIIDAAMAVHLSARRAQYRDRALALGVGLFLFAVYLLSYRGGFHSVDEVSMFAVTESLVKFGQLNTDQIAWTQWTTSQSEAQGFFGVDGHVYSKKGLATSLAMAPLYWLGLAMPGLGMLQTASLFNALVTALTAALLCRLVRRLAYHESIAVGVALLYGLTTIAWVYAKYLFSEPLAALLLLGTTYFLVCFGQETGSWQAVLAGSLTGLAVATRANNLFLVPIFGIYLLATGWRPSASQNKSPAFSLQHLAVNFRPLMYYLLGLIPPALLLMGYNWVRAGNPMQTGYDLTLFSSSVWLGLYKLLFSPLRGFLIYSPILILSVPGIIWLWKQHGGEAALILGVTGVTLGLFSIWASGEGLSWGSRFLVPVVPFLCLALAPVLQRALAGSKALAGLLVGLGSLSLGIQFLGIAINPWVYLAQLQADFGGEFFLENTPALTDFRYTQVFGQLQSWSLDNSDIAWWQPGSLDLIALVPLLLLVAFTIVNLKAQISNGRPRRFNAVVLLLTIAMSYFSLAHYFVTDQRQFGPSDGGYSSALSIAASQARPNDRIVTVAPRHYHVAMNRFKARIPILGFARQEPPLPQAALSLLRDCAKGQNAWLVTVGFAPAAPDNAVEKWLTLNTYKASDQWFDDARLVWYGAEEPTDQRVINATLGQELQLVSVRVPASPPPEDLLPVEFAWLPIDRPSTNYSLFLQLLDADGRLVAQHDGPPNGGYTPTSTWSPGQEVIDRHGLPLAAGLPAADYRLIAGLYDPASGQRLAVSSGGDFVDLGTVSFR